jgi:hypothetical protein
VALNIRGFNYSHELITREKWTFSLWNNSGVKCGFWFEIFQELNPVNSEWNLHVQCKNSKTWPGLVTSKHFVSYVRSVCLGKFRFVVAKTTWFLKLVVTILNRRNTYLQMKTCFSVDQKNIVYIGLTSLTTIVNII